MATPMTPDQWIEALRAEGVTDIVEMPGWRTHNRGQRGDGWGDVHATMVHHTAGEGPGMPAYVFNGSADLPGPLCHDFLARSGRLYLVGNGRANHAGMVARNAYNAVLNEESHHPEPGPDELDGNAVSYGLEVENDGSAGRAWPAKQYDVAVRVQAARCRFHNWSADSVWAHKEATRRKPLDPRRDMDDFRRDVAERLEHPPGWNPGTTTPEEDDMDPVDVWAYTGKGVSRDAYWHLRDTNTLALQARNETRNVAAKLDALKAPELTPEQLDTLAAKVAAHPTLAEQIAELVATKLATRLAN
ncbi:N-acetylmuramoyl-L-alanine amidase [Streptomyces sp. NPDC057271]|uniref:peptidoglycan recognition protein family protein n=1 Tax=unclassified Streptomyces TaxID=2593676 RepID=UPI00362D992E